MSASEQAAALRRQAEELDELAVLEDAAAEAKGRYQRKATDENKAAHREASQALTNAREARRVAAADAQDANVTPEPASVKSTPGKLA